MAADCVILGDDPTVGFHQFRKECATYSIIGIDSQRWNNRFKIAATPANTVIISLGKNDKDPVDTKKELTELRKKLGNAHVFWVVPSNNPKAREAVLEIAGKNGDETVESPKKITERDVRGIK